MFQKISYVLLFIGSILLTSSCITIESNNSRYASLPGTWKNIVVEYENIDSVKRNKIHKIDGSQLRHELNKSNKSFVYIIDNKRQEVASLIKLEKTAKSQNIDLFLIMQNYEFAYLTFNQKTYTPIFVIDDKHYNKKSLSTYKKYFVNDMLGNKNLNQQTELAYLYYFEKGNLIDCGDYSLLKKIGM